jgi:thiamine-phosphate pyrophosphorylase
MAAQLAEAAAAVDIACILLRVDVGAGDHLLRTAAARLRTVTQSRGIALLVDGRFDLVETTGADGVNLMTAAGYAEARRHVGDAIVGVVCASRDGAMTVAEAGADYVVFGDFEDPTPTAATVAFVEWWAAVMTVPCVAAGGAQASDRALLARAGADFVAVSDPGWSHPASLAAYLRMMTPGATQN